MSPGNRLRAHLWILIPTAVLILAVADGVSRSRHVLEVAASYGVTVDAPAIDPSSPTGYQEGRRSLVPAMGAADTAHWIMHTQAMLAGGGARIRQVDYDNAPDGREVHWGSPYRWWLGLLAHVDMLISGRPAGAAVERAALWSGPVMFVLALPVMVALLRRHFSPAAAVLAAIGSVACYPFYIDFLPVRADHHGIASLCGFFTVLGLLIGSLQPGVGPARRWFTVSAMAGGLGLWISAATQIPVLVGCGLGVLAAAAAGRKQPDRLPWMRSPDLFRHWALVGAGFSLVAWLIEYFPRHLGMRLEVNHPLYAFAWAGAGEVLRLGTIAIRSGKSGLTRIDWKVGAAALGAIGLLPLIILLTTTRTFVVADSFLWRIHYLHIAEFQGLVRILSAQGLGWNSLSLLLPMGLLVPPVVRAFASSTPPHLRALLLLALLPALLVWVMGWNQIRWLGLAFALSLPALALYCRIRAETPAEARGPLWVVMGIGLLFTPGLASAVNRSLGASEFSRNDIISLAERDVAHWLRLREGTRRVVVAGSPSTTTRLIHQGGLAGLGTLYWENADGLKKAAALYGASSVEEARERVRDAGITHFVFYSWDGFELSYAKLQRNLPEDAPVPADSFIARLLSSPIPPPWLKAIPFRLPDHPSVEGERVMIWEVTEPMSPVEQAVAAVQYHMEMGAAEPSRSLIPTLSMHEQDLSANIMLAGFHAREGNRPGFSTAFDRILRLLPEAERLSLADHIRLTMVLAVAEQLQTARQQLQRAVQKVNESSLRRLTPDGLSDLLTLCEGLQVSLPDPGLQTLAERLLPPLRRE